MKLNIVSDLHLDVRGATENFHLPGGEVLLVAGDMCEADHLGGPIRAWIQEEFAKYERVYCILGNHEHYGEDFNKTPILFGEFLDRHVPNARLLTNEAVCLNNNVVLFGGTMWTSMNNADWFTMKACEGYMVDYQAIRMGPRKFTPMDTASAFKQYVIALEATLNHYAGSRFIVMSHHLPSMQSIPPQYQREMYAQVNHAFATEMLVPLIEAHPEIELWVHGHTHASMDYYPAYKPTRVVCNPRGYAFRRGSENGGFNPNFTIEV